MRGVISNDYPNGKEHRLLPGVEKPGDRSSERKSKSSMFSRRYPGEPERFEVTIARLGLVLDVRLQPGQDLGPAAMMGARTLTRQARMRQADYGDAVLLIQLEAHKRL